MPGIPPAGQSLKQIHRVLWRALLIESMDLLLLEIDRGHHPA
jgi:hypothetical protein